MTFGLGGIFVEAIRDFGVWPAPLTLEKAREMIQRIRGYRILTADLEAVAKASARSDRSPANGGKKSLNWRSILSSYCPRARA
ncbi:MAG: acetate--CoA ligase family protein, partial [Deltaproteobacteria bacterium]|nr:acetate--CoA ligase family protein [Deltaproteobacteria bacterium]